MRPFTHISLVSPADLTHNAQATVLKAVTELEDGRWSQTFLLGVTEVTEPAKPFFVHRPLLGTRYQDETLND